MAEDVFGRTPFGSIIACVLVCLGVGLFCGTLYTALEITLVGIFEDLFYFRVKWLESLQILFIVLAVVMGMLAIMFLVFGILATGATRQHIYAGAKCIMGGRISALFNLVLTVISNVVWVGMTSVVTMAIIVFWMLWSICDNEIEDKEEWYLENYCLNLSRFGIYRNYTEGVDKNAICGPTDLDTFCTHVKQAEPMYILAFCGSLLIVLGLVGFLLTLTVNYHKIMTSKELTEYRNAVEIDFEDTVALAEVTNATTRNTTLSKSAFSSHPYSASGHAPGSAYAFGNTSGYSSKY